MQIKQLSLDNSDQVLTLEREMYWTGEKWHDLWQNEARFKFRDLIQDYLTNFPTGCFGLFGDKNQLLGAIFFTKLSQIKPIPYLHKLADYFNQDGQIAYVEIFVVKKGDNQTQIAEQLYQAANQVAQEIGCHKIAVVIYSSPLEEDVIKKLNYQVECQNLEWEIYPGKMVDCKVYTRQLDGVINF